MQRRSFRPLPTPPSNVARSVVLVVASMGSLALSACGRGQGGHPGAQQEGVGAATITSADLKSSVESAAMRIAEAHCSQAETCTRQVSSHYAQENAQVCRSNMFTETMDRLDAKTCPLGVNEAKLPDCLAAMQGAGCLDPIDMYTRYAECKASALCFKPND
ncbi:hypothetical protein AKJ09_01361 [Labilithrix luteola]|uniref:Lipoprotein n=1 Tax=Labilithrix luteola TaxID=1391654 RepID=A0A0K1PME3_9BACT|nr:DUF6184 family natural product biosynthesis lipoprotein [Labilithrix luteola]AKU94697.1 hypothetical protein AKJ09_01361 [Labilithrix luteola]